MADDQLRTRLLAYRIWEAEGCPEGQAERHWHLACRLVAAERITDVAPETPAPRARRATRAAEESVPAEGGRARCHTSAATFARRSQAW